MTPCGVIGAALTVPDYAATKNCRGCSATDFTPIVSLGRQPLANALVKPGAVEQEELVFPLDVVRCRSCGLVQLAGSVAPEALFSQYVYFSSFSDAFLRHAQALADDVTAEAALGPGSLVIEIASNDGYLLQYYKARGIPVLGIEPASNVARVAIATRGIPTITEFFDRTLGARLAAEGRRADVVHAHNVIAHVPDLAGVLAGIREVLKPGGMGVIEVPYLLDMVDKLEFDTIYHEHLCYFSLTSLKSALDRVGLSVVDVRHVPIHGGSIQVRCRRLSPAEGVPPQHPRVREMLRHEQDWGVGAQGRYEEFARGVVTVREQLRTLLSGLKRGKRRIVAYGAAAKGAVLLNYCGIGRETLDFVCDRSTVKHGLQMPGVRLPIVPVEELLARQPDYALLLAWNFVDEVLAQQAEYRQRGGRFIVPVPVPTIL